MNVTKGRLRAVRFAAVGAVMMGAIAGTWAVSDANAVRLAPPPPFGERAAATMVSAEAPVVEVRLATYRSPDAATNAPGLLQRIAAKSAELGVPAPAALPLLASAVGLALFGFARGRRPRA